MEATKGPVAPVSDDQAIEIVPAEKIGYLALVRVLFSHYPSAITVAMFPSWL
ncbi:MAG TPA: hypothetical protein VG268_00265 [Streptosporangiaceae bacterium]|nr:hypothetical protein [Streptosporangiaceae bacterium]